MNLNSQLTFSVCFFFFIKGCFPCEGLRLHFFFREKRTRESTGTVGRSNLHDTEFSFIAINMNEHRSPLKESSTFFSVSHMTLPLLYIYIYISSLSAVGDERGGKKKKKKIHTQDVFSIWIDRFANINLVLTTTISSKVSRKSQIEFHSFQTMVLLSFFF